MASSEMTPESVCAEVNPSKNVPWFLPKLDSRLMTPALVELLEKYSGIPKEEQEQHLLQVRDEAWEIFPMPCIGLFGWLGLGLSTHPHYSKLLSLLKSPAIQPVKFLDLGTCVGQDVRKLLFDGIPLESVYGSDLFPDYEKVGYSLFKDSEKLKDHFIAANFFDPSPSNALRKTEGTWDAVSICMFLHGFSYDDQLQASKLILRLLKPRSGSMVAGHQSATEESGEQELKAPFLKEGLVRTIWRHSKETFREMWERAGKEEGAELRIWVDYKQADVQEEDAEKENASRKFFQAKNPDAQKRLYFLVERV